MQSTLFPYEVILSIIESNDTNDKSCVDCI